MAQEDYLSGSAFGQVAGSLLASNKKRDKKERNKALLATVIFETLGALQKNQKQGIVDGANAVKEKYNDIFTLNKEEFSGYDEQRKRLKEYQRDKDTFLNREATARVDNTDIAIETGVTFNNRKAEHPVLQKSIMESFNKERNEIKREMEILEQDPRATFRSFTAYNQEAKKEYLAALKAVEDDPTKQGLIKAAFNRIFKTERNEDGVLITTNAEKLKLEKDLRDATTNRNTFRTKIETANNLLEKEYEGVGSTTNELLSKGLVYGRKPFTAKQIEDQTSKVLNLFIDKDGNATNFAKDSFSVNAKAGKILTPINILEKIKEDQIVVQDENGERNPISTSLLYEEISKRMLANNQALIKSGDDPLVGPRGVQAALDMFAKENRFIKRGSDIIFIMPSKDGKDMPGGKATISDLISISQQQGQEIERDLLRDKGYNSLDMLNALTDNIFQKASPEEQKENIKFYKELFPSASEEIDLIATSSKIEFLNMKKAELEKVQEERPGFKRFLPESWIFRGSLGTLDDINNLIDQELKLTK